MCIIIYTCWIYNQCRDKDLFSISCIYQGKNCQKYKDHSPKICHWQVREYNTYIGERPETHAFWRKGPSHYLCGSKCISVLFNNCWESNNCLCPIFTSVRPSVNVRTCIAAYLLYVHSTGQPFDIEHITIRYMLTCMPYTTIIRDGKKEFERAVAISK